MQILLWILTGIIAYLLGSIPFGFLIAKTRGVDVRTVGSKNIGASNVFRSAGKGPGIATFVLDMGKGFFATLFLPLLLAHALNTDTTAQLPLRVFSGVCAIVGHNWTCFLSFKGGKGIATSLGFLLGLVWQGALLAFLVWLIVFLLSRYASLASITAAAVLGISVWFLYPNPPWIPAIISVLALLAILKHHANIRRLLNGTESRISFSRKKDA